MIIEKKSTLPSVEDITVPFNYLLIKMEESYTTYQRKGVDVGISTPEVIYDEKGNQVRIDEKLVSPFGRVMKTPMNLIYNGREIKKLSDRYKPVRASNERDANGERKKFIADYSALSQITALKKESLSYDTDMEVRVGDRVHVSYIHFLNAEKEGLFIDTDQGKMVLVKYDLLRMTVHEDNQPKKMLNGYILITQKQYEVDIKQEEGVAFTERESGIVLLNPTTTKRTRKNQIGVVKLCGTPLRGYLEIPNQVDARTMYEEGEMFVYDPRYAVKLENDLHQIISAEDLYIVRREAILLSQKEFWGNIEEVMI